MSAGTLRTFSTLFDDIDYVEIPIIQRDYAQGRVEAEQIREAFLAAIRRALVDGAPALNLDFIYGSVEGGKTRTLLVLDGQQRLTTLFLLHWLLAAQDGTLSDFRRRWGAEGKRARFRYSTRPSAGAFFRALVFNDFTPEASAGRPVSLQIRDAKWFIDAWHRDPTVRSAVVMLDSIHEHFAGQAGLYQVLTDGQQVAFQFLELHDFGLQSDDLYIKMNARGKPLTPFENFKAWLVERVSGEPWGASFATALDQRWTDYFWTLAGRKSTIETNDLMLRFFYLCAYFDAAGRVEYAWSLEQSEIKLLNQLRSSSEFVSFSEFDARSLLTPAELRRLADVLDFLVGPGHTEAKKVLAALSPRLNYDSLLRLHALMVFARSTAGTPAAVDEQAQRRWLRVTDNLIANSRIDDLNAAVGAIRGLSTLGSHAPRLYEALSEGKIGTIGFNKEQVEEEAQKARLWLQGGGWDVLLAEAEGHWYLQGRIRSLLKLSARAGQEATVEAFGEAWSKLQRILTRDILESHEYPLQRALLALYDFMPAATSGNHTFCVPRATTFRDRSDNWLAVVEDARFHQLLDRIDDDGMASLGAVIRGSMATGWRACLVREPALLHYCGHNLVRKSNGDVFLLSKVRLIGYYTETRAFALFQALARLIRSKQVTGVSATHFPVYGVDTYPHLEVTTPGGKFLVKFRAGKWHCEKGGLEQPLPPEIAAVAQTIS